MFAMFERVAEADSVGAFKRELDYYPERKDSES